MVLFKRDLAGVIVHKIGALYDSTIAITKSVQHMELLTIDNIMRSGKLFRLLHPKVLQKQSV